VNVKSALITGGAAGIGKRTAIELAANGVSLAINYRSSRAKAEQLAVELTEKYGTQNIAIQGDIASAEDCRRIAEKALETFGSIDILVHNAGPYIHERKRMADYSLEDWSYLMNGNVNAVFWLTKLLLPKMREKGFGRVITIGFDRVETAPGWIYRSAFAAAKTAAASLTRTLALEESENGITANMVCPGDIVGEWKEKEIIQARELIGDLPETERDATGEDIARVISFLSDDNSAFITGSIIPVTGGKDILGKAYRRDS
jgi:3-oxoacyl-[acyl-carrier protein] reductase